MKRIWVLLLCMVMLLGGCRKAEKPGETGPASVPEPQTEPEPEPEESPESALKELLQAVSKWDTEQINDYLPEGKTVEELVPEQFQPALIEVAERMEYTIGNAVVEKDTAVVSLTITAVDAQDAFNEAAGAVAVYVMQQKISGGSLDYLKAGQVLVEALDIPGLQLKTFAVTAHMVRGEDEQWRLDLTAPENVELMNALSGGLVDLAEQLQELAVQYGFTLPAA